MSKQYREFPFAHKPEMRLTDWIPFNYSGLSHYRSWTKYDSLLWWQRHEWKRQDGSTYMKEWIRTIPGFSPKSKPCTETIEKH